MLNQFQCIGNLGADPECKRMNNGSPVVNLSIAVTEKWKSKDTGERKERTEWIRCVIFSEGLCKVAEQYLKKGSKVFISGKLQSRKYQDSQGQDKYTTEIVLQGFDAKLVMLDGKPEGQSQGNTGGSYQEQSGGFGSPNSGGDINDEVPFEMEWRV